VSLPVASDEPLAPESPAATVIAARPAPRTPPSARALLLALAALLLVLQGARGLWDPDEGRYSAVAWNMVATGDWFTPHLSPEVPHFTKPPLTYWALAASMTLLGRNETALRLPGALAAILTVLLVYALGKRLVPADPLLAATVQATALLPFVAAHLVTTDPLLALFETLAVFGFVAAWWDEPATPGSRTTRALSRWAMPVMWLGFGLAFLTKGPPGLLPLLPIVVFAGWTGRARGLLRLLSPVGIALFALTAFSWYLLQMRLRPDLLGYLLGFEVGGRLVGAQSRNPGWNGLLVAIVSVVIAGLLPWSAAAVFVSRRRRREAGAPRAPRAGRFLWLWLLLPLLVFSVVQSRQPLYLLPLAVPGSLLVARRLAPVWTWSRRQRGWLAVWAVALLALAALGAFRPEERDGRRFTAAVLRLADKRPSALIFVDRHARYSATMYCRCEVESVQLLEDLVDRAGPAYRPITETLAEELSQRESGAVWLIRPLSHAAWLQAMTQAGWRVRRLGSVEDYPVYAAEPPPLASAAAPLD
jgi:4-amino-4-deoxy-L-arabinose transferase